MSLTTWHYAEFAALIRRNLHRYFTDKDNGPIAVSNLIVESNLLRDLLAAEREAGAAEVRARVRAVMEGWQDDKLHGVRYAHRCIRAALNGGE